MTSTGFVEADRAHIFIVASRQDYNQFRPHSPVNRELPDAGIIHS